MNAINQAESSQADKSWIQQALNTVRSSVGIDPLKYWAPLMNTDSGHIAMLAMEVLAIPATTAPIERIFSQAGMATCKHRNRTEFQLFNSQLIVYCDLYVDDL
uniref:HAT C-terminal dimerisation domain-containing protein n=1 Tax=Ditylenchus dipsaci TaxID=166011 RepID=A0A915CLF3_9BILA